MRFAAGLRSALGEAPTSEGVARIRRRPALGDQTAGPSVQGSHALDSVMQRARDFDVRGSNEQLVQDRSRLGRER